MLILEPTRVRLASSVERTRKGKKMIGKRVHYNIAYERGNP